MKSLTKYLNEKLVVNKYYNDPYTCVPTSWEELRKIIEDRYNEFGPGTKQKPIDFNDVDVSGIYSFRNKFTSRFTTIGIFQGTKFEYIDISNWDVSNVENMEHMFYCCRSLTSVGDLSNWNVSNVKYMNYMFYDCYQLTSIGDLSNWDVSNVTGMTFMFCACKQLKSVGDLSNWNVSNVKYMDHMFNKSGITNIPKWYKR